MARTRTRFPTELLLDLHTGDVIPLHRQLEQELRGAIRAGRLQPESALPSTRVLAEQLDVSRGVVVEAYEQLVAEGYLTSVPGGATSVATRAAVATPPGRGTDTEPEVRINFAYGRPDVTLFPRPVWLRSLRRVLVEAPSERLTYLDRRGAPELREALAAYLNRVRGTAAEPADMIICNGFAQAIDLVTQLVKSRGGRRIAVEDPGDADGRSAVGRHGLDAVPLPVDDGGISIEALHGSRADAVFLTPAHHYPTGAVMAPDRRADLLAWADEQDALILEDDYDAEYRYDREPIGAIHGLAPERVIYAGSASKTLAPGLRLGWMVVPHPLVDQLAGIKEANDRGSASLDQLAFADFLSRGEFDRHLRRMRPIYRERRDAMLDALNRHLPEMRTTGASAGLHVLAMLPAGIDEASVIETALAAGVKVTGLRHTYEDPARAPGGLILGYGLVSVSQIDEGVRLLSKAIGSASRRRSDPRAGGDRTRMRPRRTGHPGRGVQRDTER
jgi:GntR family transcriptional regulator / MocR family aminotransferase